MGGTRRRRSVVWSQRCVCRLRRSRYLPWDVGRIGRNVGVGSGAARVGGGLNPGSDSSSPRACLRADGRDPALTAHETQTGPGLIRGALRSPHEVGGITTGGVSGGARVMSSRLPALTKWAGRTHRGSPPETVTTVGARAPAIGSLGAVGAAPDGRSVRTPAAERPRVLDDGEIGRLTTTVRAHPLRQRALVTGTVSVANSQERPRRWRRRAAMNRG